MRRMISHYRPKNSYGCPNRATCNIRENRE
jgi:hypothetical protein